MSRRSRDAIETPCGPCCVGYGGDHHCDCPENCPCDRTSFHTNSISRPTSRPARRSPMHGLAFIRLESTDSEEIWIRIDDITSVQRLTDKWSQIRVRNSSVFGSYETPEQFFARITAALNPQETP